MSDDRASLTLTAAKKLLVKGKKVHTFRQIGSILFGCDIEKKDIIVKIRKYGVELSGENMSGVNHGLALKDDTGWLFIETKMEEK